MWSSAQRTVLLAQRIVIGGLLLAALAVMITGVFLRYVMVPISYRLDIDVISFFWVEETGEMIQTYLALIGGAIAIAEGAHFTVNLWVNRLPAHLQQRIHAFNCAVIAVFGGVLAWQGWLTAKLNWSLGTPALGISLGWFYAATILGGVMLIAYALRAAALPPPNHLDIKAD
jgi:TRAP-type C4-dicarboxylate transport system permease small subunit